MKKVGVVGLDTSHSEAFASTLQANSVADVTAVYDGRTVRDDEYVAKFCERYDVTEFDQPEEMIGEVDGVMILTVNWDRHCELALPFLEAGVPTLVDKPIAGRLQDLKIIRDAADGSPFFGGSALPYHPKIEQFCLQPNQQTLYCAGYDDTFYYGCHLADAVRRIAGSDWTDVQPASDPGLTVDVQFENGTFSTVRLDEPEEDSNFTFLNVGKESSAAVIGSNGDERQRMYDSYIDTYLQTIDGDVDESHRVFDGGKLLLGIHAALSERKPVSATSGDLAEIHIQGDSFVESYEPYY